MISLAATITAWLLGGAAAVKAVSTLTAASTPLQSRRGGAVMRDGDDVLASSNFRRIWDCVAVPASSPRRSSFAWVASYPSG